MKLVYEFIGTFFLVFTVGMTVLNPNGVGILAPLAIGSILTVMVFAGGHISGGHYNPAVSLAAYLRGKLTNREMLLYWAVQFVASLFAAAVTLFFKGLHPQTIQILDPAQALVAEFLFTFALCYVVLNVATAKETKGNSYFGFAIGFTVLVGGYAVGAYSMTAFNPAVALGMTVMNASLWSNLWIYFAANLLGGAAAATVFKFAHAEECAKDFKVAKEHSY